MGFYTGFADGEIFEACTIFVTLVRMAKIFAVRFKRRLQGIWHFTSVQSIIIRVEGYFSLNCSGMCLFIISLVGHMGTSLSLKYKRFTQVIIILLIVV